MNKSKLKDITIEEFYEILKKIDKYIKSKRGEIKSIDKSILGKFKLNFYLERKKDKRSTKYISSLTIKHLNFIGTEFPNLRDTFDLYDHILFDSNIFDIFFEEDITEKIELKDNLFKYICINLFGKSKKIGLPYDKSHFEIKDNKLRSISRHFDIFSIFTNTFEHLVLEIGRGARDISIVDSTGVELGFKLEQEINLNRLEIKNSSIEIENFPSNLENLSKNVNINNFFFDGLFSRRSEIKNFEANPVEGRDFFNNLHAYFKKKGNNIASMEMYSLALDYHKKMKLSWSDILVLNFSYILSKHRNTILPILLLILGTNLFFALLYGCLFRTDMTDILGMTLNNFNILSPNPYIETPKEFVVEEYMGFPWFKDYRLFHGVDAIRRIILLGLYYEFIVTMRRFVGK